MNEISYTNDQTILKQIGSFVRQTRIRQHITQNELAEKAAISRSTLSLLERGESISLDNLIKILRILDALYVLEHFQTTDTSSPLQLAKQEKAQRKRARNQKTTGLEEDLGW